MNKRGLSDVITNVLIILLVLIAIGIIASFVLPLLRNTGTQIQEAQTCLNVKVNAVKCIVVQNGSNYTTVNVERTPGVAVIKDVKLVVENPDGSTVVRAMSAANRNALTELATVIEPLSGLTIQPKAVGVSVLLNGSNNACPESPRITCTFQ